MKLLPDYRHKRTTNSFLMESTTDRKFSSPKCYFEYACNLEIFQTSCSFLVVGLKGFNLNMQLNMV